MRPPRLAANAADVAVVTATVRAAGTSFYRGMRVLPADRRHAMYAVYAFCRIVDDIADEPGPLAGKRAGLAEWRERVGRLIRGEADQPVTRVLARAAPAYALRETDLIDIIDGMEMDCEAIVAPDLRTLDLYCDRVAAAVGRLSVRIFGDASPAADEVAHALGRALQMTNILRDIAEDAARGRLYLPREYLADAGVPPVPVEALAHPALPTVCRRLAKDAHENFRRARAAMRRCDRRAMRPARLMSATYAALLARVEQRGWTRLDDRVRLSRVGKLWLALRYGLL